IRAGLREGSEKRVAEREYFAGNQCIVGLPSILGHDGLGKRSTGQLVGFGMSRHPYGAMAEETVVPKDSIISIPKDIDPVLAAALPSSALTSLFPLKWGAKLLEGETVLINGATGVSGKL